MLHNYYLYENDGKLSMIPWDYNLSFGAFGAMGMGGPDKEESSDATSLINKGIDTPLSGTTADSRPMWNWIVSNDEYLEKYHSAFETLLSEYFESGRFEKEIDALYEMLLPYVVMKFYCFYLSDGEAAISSF
jgi:spore coat protein CotH